MKKDITKIAIVGGGHTSTLHSAVARTLRELGHEVKLATPEMIEALEIEHKRRTPPPLAYESIELFAPNYFTPPLTRKERRQRERQLKKKT